MLIIGHPTVNETVESTLKGGGAPSAIPEVGLLMTSRTLIQFNNFMPTEGPDAAIQGKLELGKPIAFLPANKTVQDEEVLDVLGIKMQFFTKYTSDDYNLTVYVPEKGLVVNNFYYRIYAIISKLNKEIRLLAGVIDKDIFQKKSVTYKFRILLLN